MQHIHHSLNHLSIFASALILWFLGAAWYSPVLFAKPWMAILGLKKDPSKRSSMVVGMVASLIGDLVLSLVLAHIVGWAGASTIGWGVFIGCLVWMGFFAAPNLPQGIYEGRPFMLFAINQGYWLVGLVIVGGLLAVWH